MPAEVKISELESASALTGSEVFEIVQGGENKKIPFTSITAVGSVSSGTWSSRIRKRITSIASAASITVNADTTDQYNVTAQGQGLTINSPTGTPTDGQELRIRIIDDGTNRSLTFNAIFRVIGVLMPANTTANKIHYFDCVYNGADAKWDIIDIKIQA